jgi:hypothetical protein
MFPSKHPTLFVLQSVAVALVLLGMLWLAWAVNQPMIAALVVFGLNAMPSPPLVQSDGEPDPSEYDGDGQAGFVKN